MNAKRQLFWDPNTTARGAAELAAFVLEPYHVFDRLSGLAARELGATAPWNDPSFNAYVGSDRARVRAQAQALFRTVQEHRPLSPAGRLTYVPEPHESRDGRQRVRLAPELFFAGEGCCLDWVLLLAGCLLNRKILPLIVMTDGPLGMHTIAGYWAEERDALDAKPVLDEAEFERSVQAGRIELVNATRLPVDEQGGRTSFESAQTEAIDFTSAGSRGQRVIWAVDVEAARDARIEPVFPLAPSPANHALLPARDFVERPELGAVRDWWADAGGSGVHALVGVGGAGKTSIAHRFLRELPRTGVGPEPDEPSPLPPPDACFVWSFYERPRAMEFVDGLHRYLAGEPAPETDAEGKLREQIARWAGLRILLVLDGLEVLQEPPPDGSAATAVPGGRFKPEARQLARLLRWIAEYELPVRVLVSSRLPLSDLSNWRDHGYSELVIGDLDVEPAKTLLARRGVSGPIDRVLTDYGRHALTLDLLGGALAAFCGGDAGRAETLPQPPDRLRGSTEIEHGAWRLARVILFYEQKLSSAEWTTLQRLCVFRRRLVPATLLDRVFGAAATGESLERLTNVYHLAQSTETRFGAHPVVAHMVLDRPSVNPESVVEPLIAVLAQEEKEAFFPKDAEMRDVWWALGDLSSPRFRDSLLAALQVRHATARAAVAEGLGNLGDEEAASAILRSHPPRILGGDRELAHFFECAFRIYRRRPSRTATMSLLLHLDVTTSYSYRIRYGPNESDLPFDVRHLAETVLDDREGLAAELDRVLDTRNDELDREIREVLAPILGDLRDCRNQRESLRFHVLQTILRTGGEGRLAIALRRLDDDALLELSRAIGYEGILALCHKSFWESKEWVQLSPGMIREQAEISMRAAQERFELRIDALQELQARLSPDERSRPGVLTTSTCTVETPEGSLTVEVPTLFQIVPGEPQLFRFGSVFDVGTLFWVVVAPSVAALHGVRGRRILIPEINERRHHQIRTQRCEVGGMMGRRSFTALHAQMNVIVTFVPDDQPGPALGFACGVDNAPFGFGRRLYQGGPPSERPLVAELLDEPPLSIYYPHFERFVASAHLGG